MKLNAWSVAVLSAVLFTAIGAQGPEEPTLAVTGFANQVDHKDWRDARVGMGVRAMLSQALSETGLFTLLEEKTEIKAQLEAIAKTVWASGKGDGTLESAASAMKKAGAAFVASGKVFYFGKPRTRASVGPAHFASEEVVIKLEIVLQDVSNGKKLTAIGSGKAKTTAASGLFTFHGENVDADASMVGTATKKAIDDAVAEIMKKYRKSYKVK
jgi:curli biogenesis system outer membrane secretion channel CsgG